MPDEWKANAIRNNDGTFDVFFDWQGRDRRVCLDIMARNEQSAIRAVKSDRDGCLNRSKFVAALT
jgi:hypothetical protein